MLLSAIHLSAGLFTFRTQKGPDFEFVVATDKASLRALAYAVPSTWNILPVLSTVSCSAQLSPLRNLLPLPGQG